MGTARPQTGLGVSPIPYTDVITYATVMEIGPTLRDFLWDVIKRLDSAYMKAAAKKIKQNSKSKK